MGCASAGGWVCEAHPDQASEHDGCDGAGIRCSNQGCPWWRGPKPTALDTGDWVRNVAGTMAPPPRIARRTTPSRIRLTQLEQVDDGVPNRAAPPHGSIEQ
jgi:hypothetical protein